MTATNKSYDNHPHKYLEQFVRPGLSLYQLEQIKSIFDAFDLNQTGLVNPKDIQTAIQEEGPAALSNPFYQTVCDLNQQGGGLITFPDFLFYLTPNVTGQQTFEEVKKIFELFNDEKTGYISLATLRRISKQFHLQLEEEDFQEMMRQADLDKDGRVSCEQFYNILTFKPKIS